MAINRMNGENDILVNVEPMSAMVEIMNRMASASMSEPADHLAGTTFCHYLRKRVAESQKKQKPGPQKEP